MPRVAFDLCCSHLEPFLLFHRRFVSSIRIQCVDKSCIFLLRQISTVPLCNMSPVFGGGRKKSIERERVTCPCSHSPPYIVSVFIPSLIGHKQKKNKKKELGHTKQ